MIVFVSKLSLKSISCEQFHSLMETLYHVPPFPSSLITKVSQGYLLCHEKTLAYHLVDSSVVDVIFHEPSHEVYLRFDKRYSTDRFLLLDALFERDLFVQQSVLKLKDDAHVLDESVIENPSDLPCLKFAAGSISESGLQRCASLLKGMVHVVYEKNSTSNSIVAYLYHKDVMRFGRMTSENEDTFVQRIVMKLQGYMNKRVFEMPFSMNGFYQQVLLYAIEHSKEAGENFLESMDEMLNSLQQDKQDLIHQIEQTTWQIEQLNRQVEILQQRCIRNQYPLLLKGKEKEKYPGEQRDIVLDVIKEELKTQKDERICHLLHQILKENPETGHRRQMLDEIFKILVSNSQVDEKVVTDLRKMGIDLKKKSENHYKGCFFNDHRYLTSISSTPSDINAGRQIYRDLRNFYF